MTEINIEELAKEAMEKQRPYKRTLGNKAHLIIHDFQHPIDRKKYKKTIYVFYQCTFITRNEEQIYLGKHIVMMSLKGAWNQLYNRLKQENKLNEKNICITMIRTGNGRYDITLHNTVRNT